MTEIAPALLGLGGVLVFVTGYMLGWGKGHADGYEYGQKLGKTLGYAEAMRERFEPEWTDDDE